MPYKPLDLVVFGLSLSSSWGNGHATTFRALLKAWSRRGHRAVFLERDQPWYAEHRDLVAPDFCRLVLYDGVEELELYRKTVAQADVVMVGSYVSDGAAVGRFVQQHARGATAFYDIDTPVTLEALGRGRCDYLDAELIPGFDLYLSFTGGPTLDLLEQRYGSPAARPFYCSVDAGTYHPSGGPPRYDLGYLGTYSPDRQPSLERLLIEPARQASHLSFIVAGPQYPADIPWPANVHRVDHVPPARHAEFYGACRFTLNVTRADMIRAGFSPSVRLFEAAACATPIISDVWDGLDTFLTPPGEIAFAAAAGDVLRLLLETSEEERLSMGRRARRRILAAHTAAHRAAELEAYVRAVQPVPARAAVLA
ncbi:CgeB family protein [Chelatococcus reniformis]|uniref:Glycosyl transferase n=1 Tax=Chelatococcus reniformis TaxID=1494448 RepID=A0A916UMD1_9HYPH|nr:glycosyltransferase [Chelatococcus reniformis]GGC78537.1 glycosyl transferase [Chelatococcus reniformis]